MSEEIDVFRQKDIFIIVDQGETINLQYSATGGTINKLIVAEASTN